MDPYVMAQVIGQTGQVKWDLRKGYVVSVGGGSATVTVGGGTEEITGVKYLGAAPTASVGCWLMVSDTDMFILGQTS